MFNQIKSLGVGKNSLVDRLFNASRRSLVTASVILLLATVSLDATSGLDVSLGVLYVLPILPASLVLNRYSIFLLALLCAVVRIQFMPWFSTLDVVLRFLLSLVAYTSTGLFVSEIARRRKLVLDYVKELERQQGLRRDAEEFLRALVESSPAAVFTLDELGRILSANKSTKELFQMPEDSSPIGVQVVHWLPVLSDALKLDPEMQSFRTVAQCQGRRSDGEVFVAQVWFSTYMTANGKRLAAIAVDCSEEIREREEENLNRLLENNRIIAGAVSHEIRNVCGAISLVYSNLRKLEGSSENEDFAALGNLVGALERIAATELQTRVKPAIGVLDLKEFLTHLRVIIEPDWNDIGGGVYWHLPERMPAVRADSFGLTQAFLNLAKNSLRAVSVQTRREFTIGVTIEERMARITFDDTGPGVPEPQRLFEPFQQGADHVGLGLYVSRAILRSFGGDLRHETVKTGCRFVAELPLAAARGVQAA